MYDSSKSLWYSSRLHIATFKKLPFACFGPQLPAKTIKILAFPTIYLHVAGFYHLLNQHVCQETECKNRHENPIFFVWNQILKKFEKIKILNSAILLIIFLEVSFYENVLTCSKFIVIFN